METTWKIRSITDLEVFDSAPHVGRDGVAFAPPHTRQVHGRLRQIQSRELRAFRQDPPLQPIRPGGVALGVQRHLPTVVNLDNVLGAAAFAPDGLDLAHHLLALDQLAEHDMAAVQPGAGGECDAELGAVGVGFAGVRHGEGAEARVGEVEVLVVEVLAVDGFAAHAVVVHEVPSLHQCHVHYDQQFGKISKKIS